MLNTMISTTENIIKVLENKKQTKEIKNLIKILKENYNLKEFIFLYEENEKIFICNFKEV